MTITDLGSVSLGTAVPLLVAASAAISASVAIAAPDISAQLALVADFEAEVSLGLSAQLDIAATVTASLQAALTAGFVPPSLTVQANIAVDIAADLTAKLDLLQVQLDLAVSINALMAAGGVRILTFDGDQDDFGSELATELGSDTTQAYGLVLLTQTGATWTAMEGVFKTS